MAKASRGAKGDARIKNGGSPGTFQSQLTEYFGTDNLYSVLECEKTVTESQLKKAYYKRSLALHPDRNKVDNKELANRKFQLLSKTYSVLSDSEKRKLYDETGIVDGDESGFVNFCEDMQQWEDYWRLLFPKVTKQRYDDYKANYIGSQRERLDIKNAYLKHEGNFDMVMEATMFAEWPDEQRVAEIVRDLIKSDEVPAFEAFVNESAAKKAKRKRKWQRERRQFEKSEAEESANELAAAIGINQRNRASAMDSVISALEQKYANGNKGSKAKRRK